MRGKDDIKLWELSYRVTLTVQDARVVSAAHNRYTSGVPGQAAISGVKSMAQGGSGKRSSE